jgi:hypothetical protein
MFRTFARFLPNGASDLVQFHPSDLAAVLELAWDRRANRVNFKLGHPFRRSDAISFRTTWIGSKLLVGPAPAPPPTTPPLPPITLPVDHPDLNPIIDAITFGGGRCGFVWDHLIYAYMIENTRIYEIFRRVLREFLHGEKLGAPGTVRTHPGIAETAESQRWLRTTEELFYRDPPSFFITTITSHVRPDIQATRRNAYQRMFGMDLNHGTEDNKAYPYTKADAANNGFASTFEEFLREVWVGMENVNNTSGANPTDDAKIADLAKRLHDMLTTRREAGNLSREEFDAIAMMDWLRLTVDTDIDLPIIQDLRAQATSPEERLFKIAERVGLPAHGLSKNYFDIADSISRILIEIETGAFNIRAAAPALYTPQGGNDPEEAMRTIIRHWSIITGREMKARRVTPS